MSETAESMLASALKRVLGAHDLVCGAVISADGRVLARAGDCTTLETTGLVSGLLGPYGSAEATYASLDGQILPKMWAQGRVFGFVDKHGADLAVVVFGQGPQDAIEQYRLSRRVSESIASEFSRDGKG